jgi:hypothetical protein
MRNVVLFLFLVAIATGCRKKIACQWRYPHAVLVGYDSTEVDTLIVYKTAHDDFGRMLDSTLCKGYFSSFYNAPGEMAIKSLTGDYKYSSGTSTVEQGWMICIPATADTFRIRSTEWEANFTKSAYDEEEDCASGVTEIEINGTRRPVHYFSPNYRFNLKKG